MNDTPMGNAPEVSPETAKLHLEILEAFKIHDHFSKAMLDAYVVIDKHGKVLKCNPYFTSLVGKKTKQIFKAQSLDEIIALKVNNQKTPVSQLVQAQPTRVDEVRGDTELAENMNLILGVYPFVKDGEIIGSFVLIRDVTAETNLQDKYKVKSVQSITDKLTGLYNRAYFEQYLPETIKHLESRRDDRQYHLSIIMSDIDHFKKINDNYGHQAGDFVLEGVSAVFRSNFRKTDIICRYGGEEFLAILPSTDIEEAVLAANKIRVAIAQAKYEFNGQVIPVTISMGISEINIGQETSEVAIGRADAALYFSKENGRNKVSTNKDGKIS